MKKYKTLKKYYYTQCVDFKYLISFNLNAVGYHNLPFHPSIELLYVILIQGFKGLSFF